MAPNSALPKIQLAPQHAKEDLEESIDLQAVEKLHKNPEPSEKLIPKLFRRMSCTVMSTVEILIFCIKKSGTPRFARICLYIFAQAGAQ